MRYIYMYTYRVARHPLSAADRLHGKRLGARLALERSSDGRSAQDVAVAADLAIDTIRRLETGLVPTPAFLTVARLADVLGLSLDELHVAAQGGSPDPPDTGKRR